jgi:hypothetical protein
MTSGMLLSREYCHKTEVMSTEYCYLINNLFFLFNNLLYVNLINHVNFPKLSSKEAKYILNANTDIYNTHFMKW